MLVRITSLISLPLIFMFDPKAENPFLPICDAWSDKKRVRGNSGKEQELENISETGESAVWKEMFWERDIDAFREEFIN